MRIIQCTYIEWTYVLPVRSSLLMARLTPAGRPGSLHSCTGVGTIHSWEEGGGRGRKEGEGGEGEREGRVSGVLCV